MGAPRATPMRTHDSPVEVFTSSSIDLTLDKCDLAIELLIQTVVSCPHCECTENLTEIARWQQRRNRLKAIPVQRRGD